MTAPTGTLLRHGVVLWLVLACSACATLSSAQRERAVRVAVEARATSDDCGRADHCAQASPLRDLGDSAFIASAPASATPRHYALLMDRGNDALLARIHLIRSARHTIDLQTYIFDEDDAGQLVLDELLIAARRGVSVRLSSSADSWSISTRTRTPRRAATSSSSSTSCPASSSSKM